MNEFAVQYAVMMPNGQLYARPVTVCAEDFSIPAPVRELFSSGLFGNVGFGTVSSTIVGAMPAIFATRADAERQLAELAEQAKQFGVMYWGATVVQRLCTPFVTADPYETFRDDIIGWLRAQRDDCGGAS